MLSAFANFYRPRNPQPSAYYRCAEDHLKTFIHVYEERFERRYGLWRPYLQKVITRYLECGDLHHGFAQVKCRDCHHEDLLKFVLKRSGNPALAGQVLSFLSLLPSETGDGMWGMALFPLAQEGSP